MKKIRVGFSKPRNRVFPVGSYLIRLFQRTKYSHVFIKFHSASTGRDLVYEAVGGGLRFVGQKVWSDHAESVDEFEIEISDSAYTTIMAYCIDNAGTPYAHMQNIGIALANLFHLRKNPWKSGMNCSELLANILALDGVKITKPLDLITPKDIHSILSKNFDKLGSKE